MYEIAREVQRSLWERIKGTIEQPLQLFCIRPGLKGGGGKSKAEVTYEACLEVAREAYLSGLRQGYDMAMTIEKGDK